MRNFLHPAIDNLEIGVYYEGHNKNPEVVRHGGIRAAALERLK
jgi:hypothetical protein